MKKAFLVMCVVSLVFATNAMADYTIVQQNAAAPTYANTLNFDEAGTPTGFGIPTDTWTSRGITSLAAGDGNAGVDDFSANPAGGPWLGTSNTYFGNFGVFFDFEDDLTSFSIQVWDPSGAPGPIGGGLGFFVFDDGVQVAGAFGFGFEPVEPAWGGVGDSWFDITTSDGMVFDEIRILGFGATPTTFVDNVSWNTAAIPEPGTCGLFVIGSALLIIRRRRS